MTAIFEDLLAKFTACQGENTVAYANRSNSLQRAIVPDAVLENIALLRAIRGSPFIQIENGLARSKWRSERNRARDQLMPWVLTAGVVSSTGFVSIAASSMFSRID